MGHSQAFCYFSYIVGTQFESIAARKAFPSFDEPDLKATFNTTVVHNPRFKAFSNMPILSTEPL